MRQTSPDFLRVMTERGFVHQCTDENGLAQAFAQGPLAAYVGFDATADSLHVGHLVSIMALRWLQRTGNRPIVLMGGGTTRIGDPSFRDTSRPLLDDERIGANIASIRAVFSRFLDFGDQERGALMLNNADWLDGLGYVSFLRDFGRHFTVNRMLSFESVKQRLEREQSLTFLEFNYMLLQAYDFLELWRRQGCRLQMGGSDQWGNIVNGVELARRTGGGALFGLTTPLLATASGAKMGKTANGAVWLNPERLSPYEFWQFWRNTEDGDVGRFLKLFTELPLDEIARLAALGGAEINEAKKILATEATALAHGREAALDAAGTARRTFEDKSQDDGLPSVEIERCAFGQGIPLSELLALSGLASSRSEARRLIANGGARLNGIAVTDGTALLSAADLDARGAATLSAGRKRHVRVVVA